MFSVTDEGKAKLLGKFVGDDEACTAVAKDEVLGEESVEVLPEEWNLEPDEFLLVPQYLKRYFTNSAWLIVENGLSSLKQQLKKGIYLFIYLCFIFVIFFLGGGVVVNKEINAYANR